MTDAVTDITYWIYATQYSTLFTGENRQRRQKNMKYMYTTLLESLTKQVEAHR